jgi:hypothetical protein
MIRPALVVGYLCPITRRKPGAGNQEPQIAAAGFTLQAPGGGAILSLPGG